MANTITINFIPCTPAPANGYKLTWRVAGSADPYTDNGFYTESPIIFVDELNPEGTCYEGFLQSDCSESGESSAVVGNAIPWATDCVQESGVTDYTINLASPCVPGNPYGTYIVENGTPGDVIVVRASFGGLMQMIGGLFVRADLSISSPDGTSDSSSSSCYADAGLHGFSITADTTIIMVGTTALISAAAVVHNSNDSSCNLALTIIEINGDPVSISVVGCKGNSSTGGTC